jgi:hypothetical protein
MNDSIAALGIQVEAGPESDAEDIAESTERLRRELLDLDVESVEPVRIGEPPPATRAVDVTTLGALAVTIGQPELLTPVVAAVRSWLASSPRRSVKLSLDGDVLELTAVSSKEQRRLTDEWLRRHERN